MGFVRSSAASASSMSNLKAALPLPVRVPCLGNVSVSEPSNCTSAAELSHVENDDIVCRHLDENPYEEAAKIDPETASLVAHEQWATFVEARASDAGVPVQNTFVHFSDPCVVSPRTNLTA